mmetsp:Transcript_1168/g.2442  ORF Transcript_1168/g.2442 Transcript_1168/m.2442 type:complete len:101 (-) Transcript_1168:5783-6085(-)
MASTWVGSYNFPTCAVAALAASSKQVWSFVFVADGQASAVGVDEQVQTLPYETVRYACALGRTLLVGEGGAPRWILPKTLRMNSSLSAVCRAPSWMMTPR